MLASLRKIFGGGPTGQPGGQPGGVRPGRARHAVPPGQRVYAIGDIHGRLDLFTALIAAVEADDAAREAAETTPTETTIVLLGDLIDRGPDSAGVVAAARALAARRKLRVLAGNHEEMMLDGLHNVDVLRQFLRFGGRETVLSYPVDPAIYRELTIEETRALMHQIVPGEDIAFLRGMEDMVVIGDYLFVHAGIQPGRPLEEQTLGDLRWIREPFLSHRGDHGYCVVHGHTITEGPDLRPNRLGIDTGAYMSGELTALGLEGTGRWLIATAQSEQGAITTGQLPAA